MSSVIFPGQGSQYIGMAKDFYENFKSSKYIIDEIEDYTSIPISKIIFEDNLNQLNITQYTQICIFSASMCIFKALEDNSNFNLSSVSFMFGHSLGEYTALAASKKINIKDASILLKKRGELMNNSVKPKLSGMAALIGLNSKNIENIIYENNLKVFVANDNSHQQIVISGMIEDINNSKKTFLDNGVKKFVLLNVSAAFHSSIMLKAQNNMKEFIENSNFKKNDISIISNFNSEISNDTNEIKYALINQMANKVRWTESIITLENSKNLNIFEIGPGKVLSGLIKRISNKFSITSINNLEDFKLIENL